MHMAGGQTLDFKIDGIRSSRQFSGHGKATEIRVSRRGLSCDGAWGRRQSDSRKVVCAALIKSRTAVANDWIAQRLAMGHPASMSQLVNRLRRIPKAARQL